MFYQLIGMHSRIQGVTSPLPTPQGPRFPYFDFFVENLAKNMRSRDLRSASGIALAVIQSDVVF